jgi:hypothetical protein
MLPRTSDILLLHIMAKKSKSSYNVLEIQKNLHFVLSCIRGSVQGATRKQLFIEFPGDKHMHVGI